MVPWDARRHRRAAAVLLVTLQCFWITATSGSTSSAAAASECQLHVVGSPAAGRLASAGMHCIGATADVAVQTQQLEQFRSNSTGVSFSSSCKAGPTGVDNSSSRCLITICSGTVVLRDSRITLVKDTSLQGVLCATGSSKLEAYASEFSLNNATALACFDQAQLLLNSSRVAHNHLALERGGGVAAYNSCKVIITEASSINNNTALSGGGVAAWNSSRVVISGSSSVRGNRVTRSGGGLIAFNSSTALITESTSVHSNVASRSGGAVAAFDSSKVIIANGSTVHGNVASSKRLGGGGVYLVDQANVTITGSSRVHDNAANGSGGGVFAGGASHVIVEGKSSVFQNTGNGRGGGGLSVVENSTVVITGGSFVHDNVANYTGGGVLVIGRAKMRVEGKSSVYRNWAQEAGGLAAFDSSTLVVTQGSDVHGNNAIACGGVGAFGAADVTISGKSSVHGNTARYTPSPYSPYSGGGLCASGTSSVAIAGESIVHSNRAINGSGGGLDIRADATVRIVEGSSVVDNTCAGGKGGGISVGLPAIDEIQVAKDGRVVETVAGVASIKQLVQELLSNMVPGSAGFAQVASYLKPSTATVIISNSTIGNNKCVMSKCVGGGLAVAGNATVILQEGARVVGNRAMNSSGGGVALTGTGTLRVEPDVVISDNVVPKESVGSSIAAFGDSKINMPLHGAFTKCSAGVFLGWNLCREGEVLQHGACTCCAPNTFSFTNESHVSGCTRCPDNALCLGGSHLSPIAGYWHSSSRSDQMHRCPLFTDACISGPDGNQCKEGYHGNLCGACQLPHYGTTSPLRCGKCMAPGVQFGLYILLCTVTVVFVTFTVHATRKDNLSNDSSVRLTDLIKVLVQFLQYVVIIGSVSVPWPSFFNLQRWFHAASVVFGPSSGQSISLDCWLHHYFPQGDGALPLAIQRTLVYFLAPCGVFVAVVLLQCLSWVLWGQGFRKAYNSFSRSEGADRAAPAPFLVLRKLPVTALVLAYYAYPTLVKAALGFFSCLNIDRGVVKYWRPGDLAPLNATHGYWTADIQQECFAGYHRGWALGLGLPAVLVLCVGVPVAMGVGLYRSHPKANNDGFKEHFGFLYRNYRPQCMWWEAVWAAQTVVLTLVSVFSFPMERYLSVLALLVVFWASAVLQVVFKPYAMRELHRMHIISTSCLAATTTGALAVFAYEIRAASADVLRLTVTVVLCVNVGFVVWCGFKLPPTLKPVVGIITAATVNMLTVFARLCALFARRAVEAVRGCGQIPTRRGETGGSRV